MFTGKFESLEAQKQFEKWAFGQTPVVYNELMRLTWNSYHGDLYFCDQEEGIGKSIGHMLILHKAYLQGYRKAEQDACDDDADKTIEDEEQDDGADQIKTRAEVMAYLKNNLAEIFSALQK